MAHVQTNHPKLGSDTYTVHWRDATRHRRRTFRVKRDAERFALSIEADLTQGRSTLPHQVRGKTVRECVDALMELAAFDLKPRSVHGYWQVYNQHILPVFGARRIATLTREDVDRWVAQLVALGLSPATVRGIYVALSKVCAYAVTYEHSAQNPCAGTILPKVQKYEARFLTPGEVERLSVALDEHPPYGLIARLAAYTGLRAGELAALRVRDVDLMHRRIRVSRTVARLGGEWVFGTPKSARSTRTVPILSAELHADLVAYLGQHPSRPDPEAALWPGRRPGHGYPLDYDRKFDHECYMRSYFRPAADAAGLAGVRFHDLRHTFASLMAAAGVALIDVSGWMGHASVSTTDSVYRHLYETDHTPERERVAAYLARQGS